jgi:hypothetical protein
MDALASIDVFDLDDTAFPLAYCVDRMHAKAPITNEPRHHTLSHLGAPMFVYSLVCVQT